MTKRIYKYSLNTTDYQTILMPKDAKILCVMNQKDNIVLYAEVEQNIEEPYHFEIFGTGHPMKEGMGTHREYIGTVQLYGGDLVFHVYRYLGV